MLRSAIFRLGATLGLLLAATAAPADPITVPYTNDFSSTVADFHTTGSWSLNTTTGLYTNAITSGDTAATALLQASNLGAGSGQDFLISTEFIVNSYTGTNTTVGLAALGSSNTGGNFYLADVQLNGQLRLYRIGTGQAQLAGILHGFSIQTGAAWQLILEGTYAPSGDLTLDFTLTDGGAQTQAITATIPSASLLDGQYFGYRNRSTGSDGRLNVSFDNLTIVPEPGTLAAAGLAAVLLGLFAWRRRRGG